MSKKEQGDNNKVHPDEKQLELNIEIDNIIVQAQSISATIIVEYYKQKINAFVGFLVNIRKRPVISREDVYQVLNELEAINCLISNCMNDPVFDEEELLALINKLNSQIKSLKTKIFRYAEIYLRMRGLENNLSEKNFVSLSDNEDILLTHQKTKEIEARLRRIEMNPNLEIVAMIKAAKKSTAELKRLEIVTSNSSDDLFQVVKGVHETAKEAESKIYSLAQGAASTAIARDYRGRAREENSTANWLRFSSFVIMAVAGYILGSSIFDLPGISSIQSTTTSTKDGVSVVATTIDPVLAAMRILFSLFISIPAAYLARESNKHRVKHNAYEQIAMNIDAVHTLIKPLKDDEKNTILANMANRLFSNPVGVDQSSVREPFPINTGELMMKLIDKIDFKSTGQAVQNTATADKPAPS